MAQVDRLARARGESRAAFIELSLSLYLPTLPTSHSLIMLSAEPEASSLPSGLKATEKTASR